MIKLIRLTTVPTSLHTLINGQPNFMQKHGFEVQLLSADGEEISLIKEDTGIEVKVIPFTRVISPLKDLKALWLTYKYFRKEKPEIIHSNTPKSSLISMIAGFFARVPIRIYTVTGLRYQGASGIGRQVLMMMERISCFFATNVIPEGNGVMKTLIEDKITYKPLKVLGNGNINGIDTKAFNKEKVVKVQSSKLKAEINKKSVTFCFVGRIVKDKGINELLSAFDKLSKKYCNAKLLLVGGEEKELDPISDESLEILENNKQIVSTGWQSDVKPFFAASDVFVFPSYREGFPNVVMQAGALEIPSIVTNINGSNEIIEDGVNGLIIPVKDEEALYDKMELLLINKELRKKLASTARQMIVDRFEQKFVWNELLKEYVRLLDENNITHSIKL